MKAGNTCETLKPKEVVATVCVDCGIPTEPGVRLGCKQCWNDKAPQVCSELNTPDIDEVAPILPESKNENFQLPEEPEPLPTIAIWQLRGRVIELERRLDELVDRIASFNVRSSYKL